MWPRLTARGGGESWTFSARFPDRAPLGAVVVVASVRPPVGGPAAAGRRCRKECKTFRNPIAIAARKVDGGTAHPVCLMSGDRSRGRRRRELN